MDVVEFVEQVFGLHLMDYQKEFLIKVYEATRDEISSVTEYPVFTLRIGGFPYRGTSCIEG